ncbi:Ribosomal silencing factor RsfS [Candidatus Karelsulcia muelleri]|uniref:ribosome silencing factor n=1 Tax=Candidatus Karelsulcia muelleri TaxID=336810 RepID=UPI001FF1AAEB|nr:ribosome silencing factor [Candidatus Karelsulcia muelleri]UOQ27675.1 Ribosomal silencing factor RsfS [Candidatus Karelsulcia muelleri]UOQ32891.1 Ribosomal silencing factor RsfS [Candidatus Karelsulcia muelleri]UOQ38101.1 Ribosomal silencing factor RsfS [Candidatus Karelsulcia muelleri]
MHNKNFLLKSILEIMEKNSGEEITLLNFYKKKNRIYDYFIICNGRSNKHVFSLYEKIKENTSPSHTEGIRKSKWILMDYINIIVHIFLKEIRNYYQIEKIYQGLHILSYE